LKSGRTKPVTALVRMLGNAFAITRRGGRLDIRQLPKPAPAPAGVGQVVSLEGRRRG